MYMCTRIWIWLCTVRTYEVLHRLPCANRTAGLICNQAPEMVLEDKAGYGAPQDIWSLGCLLYELITGTCLFPAEGAHLYSLFKTANEVSVMTFIPDPCDVQQQECHKTICA